MGIAELVFLAAFSVVALPMVASARGFTRSALKVTHLQTGWIIARKQEVYLAAVAG